MRHSPAKTFPLVAAIGLALALTPDRAAAGQTSSPSTEPAVPAVLLAAPSDTTTLDAQIRASQLRLQHSARPAAELERLGWLFVAKARTSSDPGYYSLAGIAAESLETHFGCEPQAWLLRGHVLQTQHRFAEAEALGRQLATTRGNAADYALLGDALYDRGQIAEAASAYQRMVDLKPSQDGYARAANIRWIKGDLAGAIELQTLAVRAGGPGDPGATAWNLCRLAQLRWQQGRADEAMTLTARAQEFVPDFQPALLLRGRLLLASGDVANAIKSLARAVEILPLPEPYWVYADALRAAHRTKEADDIQARLVRTGLTEDPRTVALFLATHGREIVTAVELGRAELNRRADIVTHAVLALALANAGQMPEAILHQKAALAEGTQDARLLLHAGRVAALAHLPDAADLLGRAKALSAQLLPSERQLLASSLSLLSAGAVSQGNLHKNPPQDPS